MRQGLCRNLSKEIETTKAKAFHLTFMQSILLPFSILSYAPMKQSLCRNISVAKRNKTIHKS
jgi:hypothetical protein